ncbi:MAG: hypothetical protein ACE361_26345 [Aureliella sp.]
MDPTRAPSTSEQLGAHQKVQVLLQEYNCLHQLLLFRLNALDRRLPTASGLLSVGLVSATALPLRAQTVVLVCMPLALLWLTRTTVQHAKAKEDNLRRIDEIERLVNAVAGQELMMFQSRHPNLGATPAGRSGNATVAATTFGSLVLVILCIAMFEQNVGLSIELYFAYAALCLVGIATAPLGLARYRYLKRPPEILSPRQFRWRSHS